MATPFTFTDANFEKEALLSDKPVLVDFWAAWCGPCKMIAPMIEDLANELDGKAVIGKLDVDANQDTSAAFGVMSIPTLLILKGGKVVDRVVGVTPKAVLLNKLNAAMATA